MNWDAVGAVAEALGAAGVIASLLYVASQVRASNRASAVEAKLQSTRFLAELIDSLIQNPELNDLYLRGIADLESLSIGASYIERRGLRGDIVKSCGSPAQGCPARAGGFATNHGPQRLPGLGRRARPRLRLAMRAAAAPSRRSGCRVIPA